MMTLTQKQIQIISEVHDFVKREGKGFKILDHFFERHVLNVVKFAKKLSEEYDANTFVVVLSAYLHDITYIQTGDHEDHEREGSEFVKEYLKQFDISEAEIKQISLCILRHRGSKVFKKESIEEKIVACADAMDHIYRSIQIFFRTKSKTTTYEEAIGFIRAKLQRSWNKIELDKAKDIVGEKYEAAKVLFGF